MAQNTELSRDAMKCEKVHLEMSFLGQFESVPDTKH